MTNFQKVKTFMQTFGQEVKLKPSFSTEKINDLRYNLVKEELEELGREYGIELDRRKTKSVLIKELKEVMFED